MDGKYDKIFLVLVLVLCLGSPGAALEKDADFPKRSIRLIIPYAVGSGNDMQSRGIAPYVEKHLGVRVIIDSKPGADGRIALNSAWKAAPDGYTLINSGWPTPLINQMLFPVKYKYREFTHIFAWSRDNMILVVNSETWKTLGEFISEARNRSLAGGITGIGSTATLAGLALEEAAKLKAVSWVPFSGGGETMAQLAGKHIDFGMTTTSSAFPLISAGKLSPLLVFSNEKDYRFLNTPLPKEVGLNLTPMGLMWSVMGPPNLPRKVAHILEQAFYNAVEEPGYRAWAKNARTQISPLGHEKFLAQTVMMEKEVVKRLDQIKTKFPSFMFK